MLRLYDWLVRLYPEDVQYEYGLEMLADFQTGHDERRRHGRLPLTAFVCSTVVALLFDVLVERTNMLYSHRSFHGRGRPDSGVVRPRTWEKRRVRCRAW